MVNYPQGLKKTTSSITSHNNINCYGGRGNSLEDDLNRSNEYYREAKIALIYKKPTPIQVVRVDYPNRSHAKIVEAYYRTPSTTDYNGIYRGRPIDFEAKETVRKTLFPFKYIHPHQVEHLKNVIEHGGIAFLIIRFIAFNETYVIDALEIINRYHGKKRSISYQDVKANGRLIQEGLTPRLHYLKEIDALYFKEDSHNGNQKEQK